MQHTTKNSQWLGYIALQSSGSISTLFDLALQNGRSITEDLPISLELQIKTVQSNKSVRNYYQTKGIVPATALTVATDSEAEECEGGIGCMQIEVDFIVSEEPTQGIGDMEVEQTLEVY